MLKMNLFTVAFLALSQSAYAAEPPSAGGQIRQIPPVPSIQKAVPKIQIEPSRAPAIPDSDQFKILVKSLHLTGQTIYSEAKLLAITGFTPGGTLTLTELRGMALKISDHYHKDGYFVAQAYLPQQDIKDGAVTIAVIEGRYGKVTLHNQTDISEHRPKYLLAGLNKGDVIASAPLERRLLLLSDLPGADVKSTLVPGTSQGASDLIVDITPGRRITGEVDADNAGNRYTGMYRLGATVNYNEPFGYGDVVTLRALTSGYGLNYLRASYQLQLGEARAGVAYSVLGYRLGEEFENLHANGTAQIASIFGNYPLIRSRNSNLFAGLAFDYKTFQDKIDLTSTVTDKQVQVLMASLYGDHRDNFGGGGVSSYSLTLSGGNLGIQTSAVRAIDAVTARSDGLYSKLGFSAMRLQNVTESISLYGSINGQLAFKNLDVSEKMELGGMYAVRAYPEGEAYADEGFVGTLESRLLLPRFSERLTGQMHLIGFFDVGSVRVNKNPWTTEPNSRTLSGAGIGFNWMEYNNFSVKAYYALKVGSETAKSAPDNSGRFWIQLVKYFGYDRKVDVKPVEVTTDAPESNRAAPSKPTEKKHVVAENKSEPAKAEVMTTKSVIMTTPKTSHEKAEKPVTAEIDSNGSTDVWSILIGTYILADTLSTDLMRVRMAGFDPVRNPGARKITSMKRLYLSEFNNRLDALTALEKVKRKASGAFILVERGKFKVCAGSFLSDENAASEMKRLSDAGFKLSLKRVDIEVESSSLTLGPFRDKRTAYEALVKLKNSGVNASLLAK